MVRIVQVFVVSVVCFSFALSQGYWSTKYAQSGTTNNVPQALAVRADGSLFLGGGFDYAFGIKTNYFVQWNPAKGWDSLPGQFKGSSFPISSIAAGNGNDVFVAGAFSGVGSLVKRGIVKWNGVKWDSVPGTFAMPNFTNPTRIVYANGTLYALGNFTKVGSLPKVNGIARWNGAQWDTMGSLRYTNSNNSANNKAFTVTADGRIYAATYAVDTWSKENVAIIRWSGTKWDTVAKGLTGTAGSLSGNSLKAHVNDIAVHGDTIYVVGAFNMAGTKIANCVARWNGTAWDSLGEGTFTELSNVEIDSLGRVYVAGSKSPAKFGSGSDAVARWNGKNWERLGTGITSSQFGQGAFIHDMTIVGSTLYLCGDLKNPGGLGTTGAVTYDIAASVWKNIGPGTTNGLDAAANAFHETSKGEIFIGGEFNSASSKLVRRLARWNRDGWDSVGNANASSVGIVKALASDDTVLYVGGDFTEFGKVASSGVVKWNGSKFVSMNGAGQPSDVRVIKRFGNAMIVGGKFLSMFGTFPTVTMVPSLIRWTGTKWDTLDGGIYHDTQSGTVNALAVKDNELYVAGSFTRAGNTPAISIAKWNGTSWSTVGNAPFKYSGAASTLPSITAMVFVGNDLYVAGKFDSIGTQPMWNLAKWNGSQWDTVSLGLKNNFNGITDMTADKNGRLYITGNFSSIGGSSAFKYVARWNGIQWENLGAATNSFSPTMSMVESDSKGNIYVSGYFTLVNGINAKNFISWVNDPGTIESVRRLDGPAVPARHTVSQNYPNPFNPVTAVRFKVGSAEHVTLKVYDIVGREIQTLVNDRYAPGEYEVRFNGSALASGMYLYRFTAGTSVETKKMILTK